MSSGVTFSGFNSIDFTVVLNAIMQQESQPIRALETRQSTLQSRVNQFNNLATKVSSLQSAATALSSASSATTYKATSSDAAALAVSASSAAIPGRYDVKVTELARAQVLASASAAPDADATAIATAGSLTIGTETINVTSATTLKQLTEAINARADAPARAAVVQAGAGSFRLVLTAKHTGTAAAFTVSNNLTGGSGLTFTDTDSDNISGDSDGDNAVVATDAAFTVNNVAITSASNTVETAIPGVSLTLFKKDPDATTVVDVIEDVTALRTKLQTFVTSYNELLRFVNDQAAAKSDNGIGKEPAVRGLRNSLRSVLSAAYETGGSMTYLSQVGVELTRTGAMQLNDAVLTEALKSSSDVSTLLVGTSSTPGALKAVASMLKTYTQAQGFLQSAQTQLTSQISRLGAQVGRLQDRLAVRRASLQQEFTAADAAMSRLRSQSGSLQGVNL